MPRNTVDEYTKLRQEGFTGTLAEMRAAKIVRSDPTGKDTASERLDQARTFGELGIQNWDCPDAYKGQSFPRSAAVASTVVVTGTLYLSAIWLDAGDTVTTLYFHTTATALGTPSHGWGALYSPALALLAQSTNDTSFAHAANTAKAITLATAQTAPSAGWYYAGYCVVASTLPTLANAAHATVVAALAPNRGGISDGSLTSTAPATATAPSSGLIPYVGWA
jgi:hypothetical protein